MRLEISLNGKSLLEKQKWSNLIAIQIVKMSLRVVQNVVLSTHPTDVLHMVRSALNVVRKTTFRECVVSMPSKAIQGLPRNQ